LLEADEDNRELEAEALAAAGIAVAAFATPLELVAERAGAVAPTVAVVDAWTAQGYEQQVRGVLSPAHLVVLTTSRHQEATWRSLGATRFLYKPFAPPALRDAVAAVAIDVR
jgi:DNA-binding response OmpR family regulator